MGSYWTSADPQGTTRTSRDDWRFPRHHPRRHHHRCLLWVCHVGYWGCVFSQLSDALRGDSGAQWVEDPVGMRDLSDIQMSPLSQNPFSQAADVSASYPGVDLRSLVGRIRWFLNRRIHRLISRWEFRAILAGVTARSPRKRGGPKRGRGADGILPRARPGCGSVTERWAVCWGIPRARRCSLAAEEVNIPAAALLHRRGILNLDQSETLERNAMKCG